MNTDNNNTQKDNTNKKNETVPIWNKYALTIKECAEYSNIGENRLRELIRTDGDGFILTIGNKTLIKRQAFELYLNQRDYV